MKVIWASFTDQLSCKCSSLTEWEFTQPVPPCQLAFPSCSRNRTSGFTIDEARNLFYRLASKQTTFIHQAIGKRNALADKILRKLSDKAAQVGCADGMRISFLLF
jgi:hypothetical protein